MSDQAPHDDALFSELFPLVDKSLDGTATDEQCQQLEQLVRSDPSARRLYLRLIREARFLHTWAQQHPAQRSTAADAQPACEAPKAAAPQTGHGFASPTAAVTPSTLDGSSITEPAERPVGASGWISRLARGIDRTRHPVYFALAVTLLFVTCCLTFYTIVSFQMDPRWRHAENPATDDRFVAQVTWVDDPWWEGFRPSGRGIPAGQQLMLRRGVAEIRYHTGAVVILEGPAEFTVGVNGAEGMEQGAGSKNSNLKSEITNLKSNSGFLARGQLAARCGTPASKGFTVQTPHARVRDLGTEFAVDVQADGAADVEVISGTVELVGQPAGGGKGQRMRLKKGQGASVDSDGKTIIRRGDGNVPLSDSMRDRLQKLRPELAAAASADAATIVTDFSNFSESGNLILDVPPHTLDQAFTPQGADIVITMASLGNSVGQEVFLSDEFATLTVGDRVSIDVPASLGGETDAGLAISSIEGLTTRENLFVWVLQNGGNVAVYNFDGSGALKSQVFGVADAPDTLFIDKTATGWSFGTIFSGTETLHLTDVSTVGGDAITADGNALGLWSDMRGDFSRTLSNLTVPSPPEPSADEVPQKEKP